MEQKKGVNQVGAEANLGFTAERKSEGDFDSAFRWEVFDGENSREDAKT